MDRAMKDEYNFVEQIREEGLSKPRPRGGEKIEAFERSQHEHLEFSRLPCKHPTCLPHFAELSLRPPASEPECREVPSLQPELPRLREPGSGDLFIFCTLGVFSSSPWPLPSKVTSSFPFSTPEVIEPEQTKEEAVIFHTLNALIHLSILPGTPLPVSSHLPSPSQLCLYTTTPTADTRGLRQASAGPPVLVDVLRLGAGLHTESE